MPIHIIHTIRFEDDCVSKIFHKLDFITSKLDKQMATIQDVQDALTALQTSVDAKQQAIADAIAALEAQIAAGSVATPEQLQTIVDGLKAVQADVDSTPTA